MSDTVEFTKAQVGDEAYTYSRRRRREARV
jgi:hypothetical protein